VEEVASVGVGALDDKSKKRQQTSQSKPSQSEKQVPSGSSRTKTMQQSGTKLKPSAQEVAGKRESKRLKGSAPEQ
jgi:hypothetical protein